MKEIVVSGSFIDQFITMNNTLMQKTKVCTTLQMDSAESQNRECSQGISGLQSQRTVTLAHRYPEADKLGSTAFVFRQYC